MIVSSEYTCPSCGKTKAFKTINYVVFLKRTNSLCASCKKTKNGPRVFSEQAKKNISEAQKLKYRTDATYAATHAQKNIGKKASVETRKKMSENRQGSKNSFYGQKHTAQTRQLMSDNHSDCSGEKNGFFGKKHKPETCQQMSSSRSTGIATGRIVNVNGFGRKGWYTSDKLNERFYYDSALEKFRMEMLDADPDVLTWTKRHGIKIPYITSNSKRRFYVPDFKIERRCGTFLEEVKGYDVEKEAKYRALIEYCQQHQFQMSWLSQKDLEVEGYRQWLNQQ